MQTRYYGMFPNNPVVVRHGQLEEYAISIAAILARNDKHIGIFWRRRTFDQSSNFPNPSYSNPSKPIFII